MFPVCEVKTFCLFQVLHSPFDDIIPRELKKAKKDKDKEEGKKSQSKATKWVLRLHLSFRFEHREIFCLAGAGTLMFIVMFFVCLSLWQTIIILMLSYRIICWYFKYPSRSIWGSSSDSFPSSATSRLQFRGVTMLNLIFYIAEFVFSVTIVFDALSANSTLIFVGTSVCCRLERKLKRMRRWWIKSARYWSINIVSLLVGI